MTKASNFKKAVRRHAEETGQRYTDALTDLEGVEARMSHPPTDVERLLTHLRDHHAIDAAAATQISVHNLYVFRIDRNDGPPWVARVFPPARPRAGAEGDAAILGFLEAHGFPAERLAAADPVTDLDGRAVLVTTFLEGDHFPPHAQRWELAEVLGRLHSLPVGAAIDRPGGSTGEDPSREGGPRQEIEASLAFLNAVDTKVPSAERARFEALRARVLAADDGAGLPEALIHGNVMHSPHHAIVTEQGPALINWKASGLGPRMVDFAELVWGTPSADLQAVVDTYRRYVDVTDDELERLEAVLWRRPLYITCFGYRRNLTYGLTQNVFWFIEPPEGFGEVADAVRKAFKR